MKILIIEDDPVSLKELKVMLEKKGYTVHTASSGREAMKYFTEGLSIDLIISDMTMPDIDGISLLKYIRKEKKFKNLPVIFITAVSDKKTVVEVLKYGISGYIVKPITPESVESKILSVIEAMPGAILVVDDEKILRDLVATALLRENYPVVTAENGQTALDILRKSKISLVISDVKMPGMTGLELLAKIKDNHPGIPVIMMTGYSLDFTKEQALTSGADDYITKPFKNVEIVTKVRNYHGVKRNEVSS